MKTITCYHCAKTFTAAEPNEILTLMLPHYMKMHADVMASNSESDKDAWMKNFHRDWVETQSNA